MATITLQYDARNPVLKSILDTAIVAGAKIVDSTKTKKMSGIDESLLDVKKGRVKKYDSVDDFFKKVVNV